MNERILSSRAVVGLFVLITLSILAWGTMQLGGMQFGRAEGYPLVAVFDTAYGVQPQSPILIAGIKVGEVTDVELYDKRARVTMKFLQGVQIRENARITIKTAGLLGDRYLDVDPGDEPARILMPGEEIQNTAQPPDFEQLTAQLSEVSTDLKEITDSLRYALASPESRESLRSTVLALGELSAQLNESVAENRQEVGRIVASVDRLTQRLEYEVPAAFAEFGSVADDVRAFVANADETLSEVRPSVEEGMEGVNRVVATLDGAALEIRELTERINRGEGTVGKLMTDPETAHRIDSALEGVNTVLRQVEDMRTSLRYRGEFRFNEEADDRLIEREGRGGLKNYFGVQIQPREDKFYRFEVVSNPRGRIEEERTIIRDGQTGDLISDERTSRFEDQVVFSAQIARRIHGLTFRGGLIENSGGVGLDYDIIDPNLQLSLSAYDFLRDDSPNLKADLNFRFWRYFFLTAGAEDIINPNRTEPLYYGGGGLVFDDEDLKLLLATMPSIR